MEKTEVEKRLAESKFPRVTEESIKAKIAEIQYKPVHEVGTLCVIVMENGWVSTGFSAPADPNNFDFEIGKHYAFENAFKPLWQLEGYLLRQKLHDEGSNP